MSFETKKGEVDPEEIKQIIEKMGDVSRHRTRGEITKELFDEQAGFINEHIVRLKEKFPDDPSVLDLIERFKANYPYHSEDL